MADGSDMVNIPKNSIWMPKNPYERLGIFDDPAVMKGAACEERFEKFTQMLLSMMFAKVYLKGNVANNGDPIIFTAVTTPLAAFSVGAGSSGTPSGLPAAIQGGVLSTADTSVAAPKSANSASVAPANNMLWTGFGIQAGMMNLFRVQGSTMAVGTGWIKPYKQEIYQTLAEQLSISIVFGPTTTSQLMGPPRLYMDVGFQQGDYNTTPGKPVLTACSFRGGAPNDDDQMSLQITLPFTFQVDALATSTTQAGDIYVPMMLGLYGNLSCRNSDSGEACPAPVNQQAIEAAVMKAIKRLGSG